jgi:hypothetical protein
LTAPGWTGYAFPVPQQESASADALALERFPGVERDTRAANSHERNNMTHNLKALGLALLAAFAMSAVAASSASAVKEFHSDIEKTVLTGTDTPGTQSQFTTPHNTIKCTTNLYEGTATAKTVKEITVTHTVTGCSENNGFTVHVNFNGCHYKFTLEEGIFNTPGGTTHTRGPIHIVCPVGKEIELLVTVPIFADCLIKIPAQTPTKPTVDYTNQGAGTTQDVEVVSTVEGITYTEEGSTCPTGGTHNDATFDANVTVKGFTWTGDPHKHNSSQHAVWIA